jgi:hypothetical protein
MLEQELVIEEARDEHEIPWTADGGPCPALNQPGQPWPPFCPTSPRSSMRRGSILTPTDPTCGRFRAMCMSLYESWKSAK